MAGWLPQAISKHCGCNYKSLQDGWKLIGWLAPTSSKDSGCNCRSPRDGLDMAGWLALTISKDFGCRFGSLGDCWGMVGRAPVALEHPIQTNTISTTQTHTQCKYKSEPSGWVVGDVYFKNMSRVHLDRLEMAGRWLGACPWLFPNIAGVVLDRYKMVGG